MRLNPNALDEFSYLAQCAIGSLDEFVELDGEGALDFADYNAVYDAVRSILNRSQDHLPTPFFWRLGRPFEIAVNLGHVPPDYFDLFNRIVDATRQILFIPSFDDSQSWLAALRIAERYRRTKPEPLFPLNAFSRGATVAQALGRLKERGLSYEMNSTGMRLSQPSFQRACNDIGKLVQNIGGFTVANNIFRILHESGRTYRGLFLFGRSTTQLPAPHEPNVPWHFIYNLAVKHLSARQTSADPLKDWSDLIRLSRDLGASLDVEEYSAFSGISGISPYLINESIVDNVLYDELFSFHQWSADIAPELFEYWIDALILEKCSFPIADSKTWIAVSKALLSNADPYQITILHRLQYLSQDLSEIEVSSLLHYLSATPDLGLLAVLHG